MNEFMKARGFDALVAKGTSLALPNGMYIVLFGDDEDAQAFGRYVGGFARRVLPGCSTRARARFSEKRKAYVAELSISAHCFHEEGAILCQDREVAGITLAQKGLIVFPIKSVSYAAVTQSGTRYVRFADGSAFCRSRSDGPKTLAGALYFARSSTDAAIVQEHGGELLVTDRPATGLYPVYVTGALPVAGKRGGLEFEAGSFRLGTSVASLVEN